MPPRGFNITGRAAGADNFAAALEDAQAVPAVSPAAAEQVAPGGAGPAGLTQLVTSASVADQPSIGVSIYSVSEILQGAGLHKSPGLVSDQFNQMISSDMQAVITTGGGPDEVLGQGRQMFSPYDILLQQARTDGKIQFDKGGAAAANAQFAGAGGPPPPGGVVGDGDGGPIPNYPGMSFVDNGDGTYTYHHAASGVNIILTGYKGMWISTEYLAKWKPLDEAANADNVNFIGSSCWRPTERQVELRRENCGTSNEAIYNMPSGSCSPPTARPGRSQHELGNAVDVSDCDRGSARWNWLNANAGRFDVHQLPSESWHWSTNGN